MAKITRASGESVAAVAKALSTLRAFVDGQNEWGVRELGVSLGLPSSTVHRLLSTLKAEGFLKHGQAEQKYTIGFEFTRLAAAVMQRHGLAQAASTVMRELSERTGESVWLALYDDEDKRIAYISESESVHASRYLAPLGREESLTDSACGIAILAKLPESNRREILEGGSKRLSADSLLSLDSAHHTGYAMLRSAEVGSAMMVAAPINDAQGRPVGGLVVPLHRFGEGQSKLFGDLVQDAGWRISVRLGARFLGGSSSGTWGDAVGLINQLLKTHMPAISVTPALGGGIRNLEVLGRGMGAYALTTSSSLFDAYHGRGRFVAPVRNLRAIMNMSELILLIVTRGDAGLRSADDLTSLRISPGEQGFSAAQAFDDLMEYLRARHPSRRKASNAFYLDYPEGKRQFETGAIDALCWLSGLENPLVRDLEMSGKARLHLLEDDAIAHLCQHNPGYHVGVLPKSAFPRWLDADARTLAVHTVLVCTEDRPADEVQDFTRALFSQRETLAQMSSVYRRLDAMFATHGLTVPQHSGAQQFFRQPSSSSST
jgi:TRAP transporter TAXI family solute receptor